MAHTYSSRNQGGPRFFIPLQCRMPLSFGYLVQVKSAALHTGLMSVTIPAHSDPAAFCCSEMIVSWAARAARLTGPAAMS